MIFCIIFESCYFRLNCTSHSIIFTSTEEVIKHMTKIVSFNNEIFIHIIFIITIIIIILLYTALMNINGYIPFLL